MADCTIDYDKIMCISSWAGDVVWYSIADSHGKMLAKRFLTLFISRCPSSLGASVSIGTLCIWNKAGQWSYVPKQCTIKSVSISWAHGCLQTLLEYGVRFLPIRKLEIYIQTLFLLSYHSLNCTTVDAQAHISGLHTGSFFWNRYTLQLIRKFLAEYSCS